ncbi:hypothetical protein [Mycobacterium uberis]|uniref:hypothetical protein n=1 Tax=Mycobacterium uberis TaxID=2162698 RepID=UPI001058A202|nr:hypothetical protein [Mycobacterium uberis]
MTVALLASCTGHDVEGAKKNYEARKYELQTRLAHTDVIPDVRSEMSTLIERSSGASGQGAGQQHQFAGLGDNVRTDPVDACGRDQRVNAHRQ